MEKYLITGGTGFVGACIVRQLVKNGESVSLLVRKKELNWRLKDIKSQVEIIQADLLDDRLKSKIKKNKPDYIFHLGAYGSLPAENDVYEAIDVNLKGTINLFEAARYTDVKLFINTGSSSEYGISDKQFKETDSTFPINIYGITKLAATLYCKKEAEKFNLSVITLRLFSPYGYYEAHTRLIPSVAINALNNKNILLSNPYNVRDFIFIEDVVDAYTSSVKVKHNPGEIYNIGSGMQHSVQDVVQQIVQYTQSTSSIKWGSLKNQKRQIEPKKWEADITKAKQKLHWKPKHSLQEGITKTMNWLQHNKNFYE